MRDPLSPREFEAWLRQQQIDLMPHQKQLALDILKLESLRHRTRPNPFSPVQDPMPSPGETLWERMSFRAPGSGLTFTFNTVEKFLRRP